MVNVEPYRRTLAALLAKVSVSLQRLLSASLPKCSAPEGCRRAINKGRMLRGVGADEVVPAGSRAKPSTLPLFTAESCSKGLTAMLARLHSLGLGAPWLFSAAGCAGELLSSFWCQLRTGPGRLVRIVTEALPRAIVAVRAMGEDARRAVKVGATVAADKIIAPAKGVHAGAGAKPGGPAVRRQFGWPPGEGFSAFYAREVLALVEALVVALRGAVVPRAALDPVRWSPKGCSAGSTMHDLHSSILHHFGAFLQ